MKRILFLTNIASPYRVNFFDELGKTLDVTVLLSDQASDYKERDAKWFEVGQGGFSRVQLKKTLGVGQEALCLEVISWLKKPWDAIVVCGYSGPTAMLAIAWLKWHRIPFYMEIDGGLIHEDSRGKYWLKKWLVSAPTNWISSGDVSTEYLVHYGAKRERVETYPFTSLFEKEILPRIPSPEEKQTLRYQLGLTGEYVVLAVGQFIHRKGFDILLKAAAKLSPGTELYIVGGEPTEEYVTMTRELGAKNVHFVGFLRKEMLIRYYQAADLFVLPTREDIWGLVINEAMACGLPVVTTERCVAGMELVNDGVNGYIVPVEDTEALAKKMDAVLSGDPAAMGAAALETIRPYTIENMAKAHVEIFSKNHNCEMEK